MEVLQRTANRGSISTGFNIDNSLKFEADNTEYLSWSDMTSYATDARKRKWSISFWFKRTEIGVQQLPWNSGGNGTVALQAADHLNFQQFFSDSASAAKYLNTNRLFRDTSAWYHIIIAIDTTQSTEAHRMRLYVNGEEETSFSSSVYPPQNATATDIYGSYISLGRSLNWGAGFSGYIADYYLISEVQLVPTDVGEYDEDSGIWKPKAYSGAISAPSTFLEFKDSSDFRTATSGLDASVANNITSADQAVDTPTNNFAMISVAMRDVNELLYSTVSEGGTKFRCTEFDTWKTAVSSIGVTKGKWYAEFKVIGARPNNFWGIASMEQLDNNSGYSSGAGSHLGQSGKNWSIGYYQVNGNLFQVQNSGYTNVSWGAGVSQNAVVSVALDMDNHKLYMAVNNTYQDSGNPVTGANAITFDATETVAIATSGYSLGSGNDTITGVNFGGYVTGGMYSQATDENGYGAFRYAPPTGYYALCTKNLAEYG